MKQNKKAIAGILIATIALAGIAVAVSAEGEGGVGPRAILAGAITSEHIDSGAVKNDEIDNDVDFEMDSLNVTTGPFISTETSLLNKTNITSGTFIVTDTAKLNNTIVASGKTLSVEGKTNLNDTMVASDKNVSLYAAGNVSLPVNAMPNAMEYNSTTLSTTNKSFNSTNLVDAAGQYWNATTINLPRKANLTVAWTGNDTWVASGGILRVNCTIYDGDSNIETTYPHDVNCSDDTAVNLTRNVNFICPSLPEDDYTISMQIRDGGGGNTVAVNTQVVVVTAYPA